MLDTVTALGGAELRIAIDGRTITIATVSGRCRSVTPRWPPRSAPRSTAVRC
jgi:hypothetical protein